MKMLALLLVAIVSAKPATILDWNPVDFGRYIGKHYDGEKDAPGMFKDYVLKFNKKYDAAEYTQRFLVFKFNLEAIVIHNRKGEATYTKGINQFTDMTANEFKNMYINKGYKEKEGRKFNFKTLTPTNKTVVDWTKRTCGGGACVTPVKNQAQCGSCWAFSATGCLESRTAILHKRKVASLSEQQLMDCSRPEGDESCEGGLMDYAFQYVADAGGLCPEDFYTYLAEDEQCKQNFVSHCKFPHEVTGFHDVPHQDEEQLKAAVAQGPVSVAIEADQFIFQTYRHGVITGDCGDMLDHGVLAVGYGTDTIKGKKVDYWLVKNSWTDTWGDKGYVKIGRNTGKPSGECGILMAPSYPAFKEQRSTKKN